MKPLADKIRPSRLEDLVGQEHIIGEKKLINRILASKIIPNMIFYGPSGTGKTTLANILAKNSHKKFFKLNGTQANTDDIKHIIAQIGTIDSLNGILLYIDEIHYLNKRQQQSILEFIENGDITLIGSTTENINFSIFKAILSRCITIEFKELTVDHIIESLKRAISLVKEEKSIQINYDITALKYISEVSSGDLRRALNTLELVINTYALHNSQEIFIDMEKAKECSQSKIINYDRNGDGHYNLLSYFQKSIRGSDPDASTHALARLVESGDLNAICRRLLVIASEDIGLAYPQAIVIVKACVDAALQLGFPEARIPLAQATVLLSILPKSNTAYTAINAALDDLHRLDVGTIPPHLCDTHANIAVHNKTKYLYPHDYPNHYVKQQYMPDNLKDKTYYEYGKNKFEQSIKDHWKKIKTQK
ncbi:replication-associated recombination protein A [Clostridium formicaceticum]|uniref:Replication-associated recombination protein A n=1 Tax=Clostridium formicaceticum TaxID=1497 RepID=A0AAC9RKR8_9CLOT|nr:replication-associated recombination protein A [Clostridium formicaceticum]AOY76972.1 hypothetical protein BJL90_14575 [Clostridium formicaceticum]ARE87457.1 Replication-associated recombination protein A [Clostridium formicaceticum]